MRAIIHPGIGKTATSAIQKIAYELSIGGSFGLRYPIVSRLTNSHDALSGLHPSANAKHAFEELKADIEENAGLDYFISSEFLAFSKLEERVELVEIFKSRGYKVDIYFGIRNYTDLVLSSYLQAVKVGWGYELGESLGEYMDRNFSAFRVPHHVRNWIDLVGESSIYLVDYDKDKESFISRFFHSIGVELGGVEAEKKVNESINMAQANLICEVYKAAKEVPNLGLLVKALKTIEFKSNGMDDARRMVNSVVGDLYNEDLRKLDKVVTI